MRKIKLFVGTINEVSNGIQYLYCLEEFFRIFFEPPMRVQLLKLFAFAHKPEFPAVNCMKGIRAVFVLF
jgi:hypothetical protein